MLSCLLLTPLWSAAKMADHLALLCVMLSCVFVSSPYSVPGQVWFLIVSISDLCLPLFFINNVILVKGGVFVYKMNPDPDHYLLGHFLMLTLKVPITTATDDKFCDIFPNLRKKKQDMIFHEDCYF